MKYLLVIVGILVAGCYTSNDRIQNMTYFKDAKTGLCFAAKNMYANNAVMSHVPCTPEVERLIEGNVHD